MTWRFAPDLPPDTPEVWQTCDGFHPDQNGVYRTGWVRGTLTTITANSPIICGRFVYDASGTEELITATSGAVTGSFAAQVFGGTTDRSGGTPRPKHSAGIAAYGNIVLISTAASAKIASRTIGAAANFADIASSPGAEILLVNPQNIVIGLNTNAGGDGWATSDVGDYTNWTTLEAASGNLRQTPGKITAGAILGNDVIAFKRRGVYRGRYVGGVVKWQWELLHAELGAWGPECAVAAVESVYFIGDSGAFRFDGAQFQKIDDGISKTLRAFCSSSGATSYGHIYTKLVYDPPNGNVTFHAQGAVSALGTGGRVGYSQGGFYSYNVFSGLWGYQAQSADTVFSASAIIDGKQPEVAWLTGVPEPLSVVTLQSVQDSKYGSLDTAISASVTTYQPTIGTGKIGERGRHTRVSRVIPRWTYSNGQGSNLSTATLKTCKAYAYNSILQVKGDVTPTSTTLSGNQYWADYQKDAQFHQFDFLVNAAACIDGVEIETASAGKY